MGDKEVFIKHGDIQVGRLPAIKFTRGLQELMCHSAPKMEHVTTEDLKEYRNFLVHTRCHLRSDGRLKSNSGYKYKYIIRPLFAKVDGDPSSGGDDSPVTGSGLRYKTVTNNPKKYVYFDDPNEIVDRLVLLHAERAGGNTGVENELISCAEELRELGLIL